MEKIPDILWLIPFIIIVIILALKAIDRLLILTVFLAPLSIQLRFIIPETRADLFIPTEMMLAVILPVVLYKAFVSGEINRKILKHPVTVTGFLIIIWGLTTSLTGTMLLVSLKSILTKMWFFAGFFVLATSVFADRKRIRIYLLAYVAGMVIPASLFLYKMWGAGIFNQPAAYMASRPFFNDHTSLGAALAFCLPFLAGELFCKSKSWGYRVSIFTLLMIFIPAFMLSYSRAAWLSLIIASLFWMVLRFRIPAKVIIPSLVALIAVIAFSWSSILVRLNDIRHESSGDFASHISSIGNITTDASNLERINRWKSGLRMAAEKPLTGWGPGTYQFQYAPYQMASEKTIISTNWGEGGNIHSEYLGALVESGIPGFILYLLLVILIVYRGSVLFRNEEERDTRYLILALSAGVVTYAVHGALNNFLDTDKISALFWGMAAAITALDISEHRGAEGIVSEVQQQ